MSFQSDFLEFCGSEYDSSHKPDSYVKAITYLCEFLNINVDNITTEDLILIRSRECFLSMRSSAFYNELLQFLIPRKQSSYLKNGFIKAAIPYLYRFYNFQ